MNKEKTWNAVFVIILFFGVLLRIFAAVARTDMVWPDEHFQSLEPASWVVFGRALLAWEWQTGYRSWFLPGLYVPVLFVGKLFGITGGTAVIILCRVFTALASSTVIFTLERVLAALNIPRFPRYIAVVAFVFSVPMILWAPTSLADTWSMIFTWAALAYMILIKDLGNSRKWFVGGLLTGLAFLAKTQVIFWVMGVGLALLVMRLSMRSLFAWGFGFLIMFLFSGLLDALTWGAFFHSMLLQVFSGVQISMYFGTSPWYDYPALIVEDLSPRLFWLILALLVAVLLAAKRSLVIIRASEQQAIRERIWLILIPWAAFFVCHSIIPHKETRFLLPMFPFFFILVGLLLHVVLKILASVQPKTLEIRGAPLRDLLLTIIAFIGFGLMSALHVSQKESTAQIHDISALEDYIYKENKSSPSDSSCVLLVDFGWAWSRGQLILGQRMDVIDKRFEDFTPAELQRCNFAILPKRREIELVQLNHNWKIVGRTPYVFSLYKKELTKGVLR